MPFKVKCPKCRQGLLVPSRKAGEVVNCPACRQPFRVPKQETPPTPGGKLGGKSVIASKTGVGGKSAVSGKEKEKPKEKSAGKGDATKPQSGTGKSKPLPHPPLIPMPPGRPKPPVEPSEKAKTSSAVAEPAASSARKPPPLKKPAAAPVPTMAKATRDATLLDAPQKTLERSRPPHPPTRTAPATEPPGGVAPPVEALKSLSPSPSPPAPLPEVPGRRESFGKGSKAPPPPLAATVPPATVRLAPSTSTPSASVPPPPPPTESATIDTSLPRTGVEHSRDRKLAVLYFSLACLAVALFGVVPAVLDIVDHFRAEDSPGIANWAFVLIAAAGLQAAYAVYAMQLPDWSTVWVTSLFALVLATLYAMVLAIAMLAGADSELIQSLDLADKIQGNKAAGWSFILASLSSLLAYFGGRLSVRWHQTDRPPGSLAAARG